VSSNTFISGFVTFNLTSIP